MTIETREDESIKEILLFDWVNDPYQMRNQAADRMDLVKKLMADERVLWIEKSRDPWKVPAL